jgi:uncharacterized ParB-like nuclease family protein
MPDWVTRTVKIESLGFTPHTHNDVSLPKVLEYAKLPADTYPPIDVIAIEGGKYEVAHGFHRLAAAWVRGDKEVRITFWE